jgi:hypothetical protein
MPQIARRHHTVPKFYLNGFANHGGRIGLVRLPGDVRTVQPTKDASVINNFYNVDTATGRPDAVETVISEQIEGPAARVFEKIRNRDDWPLDARDREALAALVAFQHMRGPDSRRRLGQISTAIAQVATSTDSGRDNLMADARARGVEISDAQANEMWEFFAQPDGPSVATISEAHIRMMIDTLADVMPYYIGRQWTLVRFRRKYLLTSDTPVSLLPHPSAHPNAGLGLATAAAIILPVSRDTGLIMDESTNLIDEKAIPLIATGRFDRSIEGTTNLATMFNQASITNARQAVYHHPDDHHLVPADLHEPREFEIMTGRIETSDAVPETATINGNPPHGTKLSLLDGRQHKKAHDRLPRIRPNGLR